MRKHVLCHIYNKGADQHVHLSSWHGCGLDYGFQFKLEKGAVPSVFVWTSQTKRKSPQKRYDSEATDTESETEETQKKSIEEGPQMSLPIPCPHRLSIQMILASNPKMEFRWSFYSFTQYFKTMNYSRRC